MAWIPFTDSVAYHSGTEETWQYAGSEYLDSQTSILHLWAPLSDGGQVQAGFGWNLSASVLPLRVRATILSADVSGEIGDYPLMWATDENRLFWGEGTVGEVEIQERFGYGYMEFWTDNFDTVNIQILLEVWDESDPPPEPTEGDGFRVYELDKGWSFDGAYIPHYLEMNWYFGDDPIHYHSIQKIRVHGMSKGIAQLTVATNGMQTDYERDFSEPQILDLPRNPKHISTELVPETNYTDSANRGLSIQMKFEGRNRDLTRPEPQHVLQVLSVQSSPAGTGFRSN